MTTSALLVIYVQQVLFDPASRCARRCRIGWTRVAGLGYAISLVADAHTTRDKPHAPVASIFAHHNATLPDITSFGVRIAAPASASVDF